MARPDTESLQSVRFRKMSFLDVGDVHAIERESFPTPWRKRTFIARLLLSDHYGYVAEEDGRLVGYTIFRIYGHMVHLQKIAVLEKCRHRRIATHLMDMMFDQARSQGAETVYLEVRVSNTSAQEFYRKFHFTLHHIEENYYRADGEAAQILTRNVCLEDDESAGEPP